MPNEAQRQATYEAQLASDNAWYTKARLLGSRGRNGREGLLWQWGIAVAEGWHEALKPNDPDKPKISAHRKSALPCRDWYLDISRAFAALCPATFGLANTGTLAWYAHARHVTREQEAIWLYYVEGLGSEEFRRDFRAMSPEAREQTLATWDVPRAYQVRDDAGDGLVAARLGIPATTAYDRRVKGVGRMVDFLNPTVRQERAA